MESYIFEPIVSKEKNVDQYFLLLNEKISGINNKIYLSSVCDILLGHRNQILSVCDSLMSYCDDIVNICKIKKPQFPEYAPLFKYLLRHSLDVLSLSEHLFIHCSEIAEACKHLPDNDNETMQESKNILKYCGYVSQACNFSVKRCNKVLFVLGRLSESGYSSSMLTNSVAIIRKATTRFMSGYMELTERSGDSGSVLKYFHSTTIAN